MRGARLILAIGAVLVLAAADEIPVVAPPVSASAMAPLPAVTPGRDVALTASARGVEFRLPDDWLLLGPERARLRVLRGIRPIGVAVNGKWAGVLAPAGDDARAPDLLFPARLLRPGANRITLLDATPWGAQLVLGVPPSARMRLPDIARALAGLGAAGVVALTPDKAARARGVAALLPPGPGVGVRLSVAGIEDLAQVPLAQVGLTPRAVALALMPPRPREAGFVPATVVPRPVDLAGRAHALAAASLAPLGAVAQHLAGPDLGALEGWLAGRGGTAVLLTARPGQLWMVLGPGVAPAPVAATLAAGRADGPHGQVAILGRDGRWQSATVPGQLPHLAEPLRPGNLRQVLGTLLSARPWLLALGLLGLAATAAALAAAGLGLARR